ncbi:MAG: glycosyltransferase family 2 protein [Acidobacteriota bacterium]|nr:glycosyltransferase family 2 protein [Acidobacteriota bacterium]
MQSRPGSLAAFPHDSYDRPMSLSVIVTSYESPEVLERCLRSLTQQPEAQKIIVVDCSRVNPGVALAPAFPDVTFVHYDAPTSVPAMRWSVIDSLETELIAAVEGRCVPAADWCATLVEAHRENPAVPAVGGPIAPPLGGKAWELGLFFSEYGHFAPPLRTGPTRELSGANLSYKRDRLVLESDLLEGGRWETLLHLRWLARGNTFYMTQAEVRFENTMKLGTFMRQRFAYGRGYAADRFERGRVLPRLAYALSCFLLPALLTFRIGRSAVDKGLGTPFLRCLLWVVLFLTAWSAGEFVGYVVGAAEHPEIF